MTAGLANDGQALRGGTTPPVDRCHRSAFSADDGTPCPPPPHSPGFTAPPNLVRARFPPATMFPLPPKKSTTGSARPRGFRLAWQATKKRGPKPAARKPPLACKKKAAALIQRPDPRVLCSSRPQGTPCTSPIGTLARFFFAKLPGAAAKGRKENIGRGTRGRHRYFPAPAGSWPQSPGFAKLLSAGAALVLGPCFSTASWANSFHLLEFRELFSAVRVNPRRAARGGQTHGLIAREHRKYSSAHPHPAHSLYRLWYDCRGHHPRAGLLARQ